MNHTRTHAQINRHSATTLPFPEASAASALHRLCSCMSAADGAPTVARAASTSFPDSLPNASPHVLSVLPALSDSWKGPSLVLPTSLRHGTLNGPQPGCMQLTECVCVSDVHGAPRQRLPVSTTDVAAPAAALTPRLRFLFSCCAVCNRIGGLRCKAAALLDAVQGTRRGNI